MNRTAVLAPAAMPPVSLAATSVQVYPIATQSHVKKGICLIVNNVEFETAEVRQTDRQTDRSSSGKVPLEFRAGSSLDCSMYIPYWLISRM